MTKSAEQLLEQVLALDPNDRAEFVDQLIVTLEPSTDPEYVAAWETEIRSRIAEVDAGTCKMIPVKDAMRMIERGSDADA